MLLLIENFRLAIIWTMKLEKNVLGIVSGQANKKMMKAFLSLSLSARSKWFQQTLFWLFSSQFSISISQSIISDREDQGNVSRLSGEKSKAQIKYSPHCVEAWTKDNYNYQFRSVHNETNFKALILGSYQLTVLIKSKNIEMRLFDYKIFPFLYRSE